MALAIALPDGNHYSKARSLPASSSSTLKTFHKGTPTAATAKVHSKHTYTTSIHVTSSKPTSTTSTTPTPSATTTTGIDAYLADGKKICDDGGMTLENWGKYDIDHYLLFL